MGVIWPTEQREEGKDDNEAIHGDAGYSSVALFGFKRGRKSYRVAHLVGKNLLLTLIWEGSAILPGQ